MQLRYYAAIVRRSWLLVLALPALVGVVSLAAASLRPPRFGASARLMITQAPRGQSPASPFPDVNLSYSWESSEFILDDLPQVVASVAFAQDVSRLLAGQGVAVDPVQVQAGLRAENFHRAVVLTASAGAPDTALAIVRGAVETLQANGLKYWGRADGPAGGLSVAVLDPPGGVHPLRGPRELAIDVGLRAALALAAAIGLAFLRHYLDDTLRDTRQAEEWTGMRVIGAIPEE